MQFCADSIVKIYIWDLGGTTGIIAVWLWEWESLMQLEASSPHSMKVAGLIPALSWSLPVVACGFSPPPHSPNTCSETNSTTPSLLQATWRLYINSSSVSCSLIFASALRWLWWHSTTRPGIPPTTSRLQVSIQFITTKQEGRAQRSFSE